MSKFWNYIKNTDFSKLTLISALLGICFGLILGERAGALAIFGNIFVRLVQMALLPYIIVAIIRALASLSAKGVKRLAKSAGIAFLIIWGCSYFVVYTIPFAFPKIEMASFFSNLYLSSPDETSTIDKFIPANPFSAIVENVVPAFVLFCICIGLALSNVKEKGSLLEILGALQEALSNLITVIYKFIPIAIFSMLANATGTMDFEELLEMQVFFVSYSVASCILTFFFFPAILMSFLPLSYREIMRSMKGILILAFSARSSFIVMPMIIEKIEQLFRENSEVSQKELSSAEVIVPLSFNFPTSGKLLNTIFIFFSAWLYDKSFSSSQNIQLLFTSFLNFFGEAPVALPFLLDLFKLPSDAMAIYNISTVITHSFEPMINAFNMFVAGALTVAFTVSSPRIFAKKFLLSLIKAAAASLVVTLLLALYFSFAVQSSSKDQEKLLSLSIDSPIKAKVYDDKTEVSPRAENDKIVAGNKDQTLRVGYNTSALPFAYRNKEGELVGYDIAMAYKLAEFLGTNLEFIPFEYSTFTDDIDNGVIDIAMSSITITAERVKKVDFSNPYMVLHMAFITPDYNRKIFAEIDMLKKKEGLKIAILKGSAYIKILQKLLPNAQIIEVNDRKDFFENEIGDAFFTTAEQGFAWTLLYPKYSVAIVDKGTDDDLIGYPIKKGNMELLYLINQWISILNDKGITQEEYNRWILGK